MEVNIWFYPLLATWRLVFDFRQFFVPFSDVEADLWIVFDFCPF